LIEDDLYEGRLKSSITVENIEKIHNSFLDDPGLKVYEIANTINISEERVRYILHEELSMRKLCEIWVPH
jgi:hypothetical protein